MIKTEELVINEEVIKLASVFLFNETDEEEKTVKDVKAIIEEYESGNTEIVLDHIDNIEMIEIFEYVFTAKDFLETIFKL